MLVRDAQGIVVQHSNLDKGYKDGGDSCARTGPLAKSGSLIDINNVPYFIVDKQVVRHPTQEGYNDPSKTSRDNVAQFMCADLDVQRESALNYAEKGWVNADILMPDVRLYLYTVARKKAPLWIKTLGPVFLLGSILWAAYVRPDDEVNQLACMLSVMPPFYGRLLLRLHKTLDQNLQDYWNGWRDQAEVGIAIKLNLKNKAGL